MRISPFLTAVFVLVLLTGGCSSPKTSQDMCDCLDKSADAYLAQHLNVTKAELESSGVSTNGMEGHWSRVKRTVRGAYVAVSPQWLQFYLNECSFQHNRRHRPFLIVEDLLDRLMRPLPPGGRKGPPGLLPTPSGSRTK
jgi:ISXO2-like transposase domain